MPTQGVASFKSHLEHLLEKRREEASQQLQPPPEPPSLKTQKLISYSYDKPSTYFAVGCADRQANVGGNDHRQGRCQLNTEATEDKIKPKHVLLSEDTLMPATLGWAS